MSYILLILLAISSTQLVLAQNVQPNPNPNPNPNPTSANFEPSLFVVIGVLTLVFFLTFSLILYARFCYRSGNELSTIHNFDELPGNMEAMFGPHTRFSGIERSVVESLPFFKFSSLKGSKHGLQCSVCLAEFEETQMLRLLPKCKHGFHIECIDQWLERHSSCPLCRQRVSSEDLIALVNLSTSMRSNTGTKLEEIDHEDQGSSIFELFIEREDDQHEQQQQQHQQQQKDHSETPPQSELEKPGIRVWHRLNHQIIISDVMFKNRWSNLSSSDLMFLNSEMLGKTSSERFLSSMKCHEKRTMSEITALSRVYNKDGKVTIRECLEETNHDVNDDYGGIREVNKRKLWFPIAKRTVEWFANRERNRSQQQHHAELDIV